MYFLQHVLEGVEESISGYALGAGPLSWALLACVPMNATGTAHFSLTVPCSEQGS